MYDGYNSQSVHILTYSIISRDVIAMVIVIVMRGSAHPTVILVVMVEVWIVDLLKSQVCSLVWQTTCIYRDIAVLVWQTNDVRTILIMSKPCL